MTLYHFPMKNIYIQRQAHQYYERLERQ